MMETEEAIDLAMTEENQRKMIHHMYTPTQSTKKNSTKEVIF
jgi:hypothetical protein